MILRDMIKELVSILKSEDLDEIEVRTFLRTVRVARHSQQVSLSRETMSPVQTSDLPPVGDTKTSMPEVDPSSVPPLEEKQQVEPGALPGTDSDPGLEELLSPMVGTFFTSASPDIDAFVTAGQHVEKGQVICIIEAMKLMNEIEAEKSGTIKKILVNDSQPVEFGQPLFLIESA
jgi:acetyl-CoA carboxylase biotin carboxyl carrier protein